MFPKMGLFKTEKLGKIKNIQVFEILCLHRPEASPNTWKRRNGKDMEIQGPVRRETDLSPFRVVPAINLNQLCTGIFLLLSSEGKNPISNLLRLFGAEKKKLALSFYALKLPTRNFSRGFRRKPLKSSKNDVKWLAQHLALPCDVRSSPLIWPWQRHCLRQGASQCVVFSTNGGKPCEVK